MVKVLLSAYACEPGKGSEPGVGWRWAVGLSERVSLTVLTREDNRRAIEAAIAERPKDSPLRKVTFLYHDLGKPFLWAKRRRLLPTLGYYALWQASVSRRFWKVADAGDVVHHLTFCTLLCPGFWRLKHAAYVLGPVGAPQVNAHYYPLFGRQALVQRIRSTVLNGFLHLPWLRRLLRNAAAIIPANRETRALLTAKGISTQEVILDTGAPEVVDAKGDALGEAQGSCLRLIYAGQLERRKGLELTLRALAGLHEVTKRDWVFDILGSGPDRDRLVHLARDLGIDANVVFHGSLPHSAAMERFREADAFVFTSVRDTSGGVNLEAMAHGLPVVCIAHQGVGDITDEECAERIVPGPIPETIAAITKAIGRLAEDPLRCADMGRSARKRAVECFSWDEKFDRMCGHYRQARQKPSAEFD